MEPASLSSVLDTLTEEERAHIALVMKRDMRLRHDDEERLV